MRWVGWPLKRVASRNGLDPGDRDVGLGLRVCVVREAGR
jgi:hypothetical protein